MEKKGSCHRTLLCYYPPFDETISPKEVTHRRGGKQVCIVAVKTAGHGDRTSCQQVHFNC